MSYMCDECRHSFIRSGPCDAFGEAAAGSDGSCTTCGHGQQCH